MQTSKNPNSGDSSRSTSSDQVSPEVSKHSENSRAQRINIQRENFFNDKNKENISSVECKNSERAAAKKEYILFDDEQNHEVCARSPLINTDPLLLVASTNKSEANSYSSVSSSNYTNAFMDHSKNSDRLVLPADAMQRKEPMGCENIDTPPVASVFNYASSPNVISDKNVLSYHNFKVPTQKENLASSGNVGQTSVRPPIIGQSADLSVMNVIGSKRSTKPGYQRDSLSKRVISVIGKKTSESSRTKDKGSFSSSDSQKSSDFLDHTDTHKFSNSDLTEKYRMHSSISDIFEEKMSLRSNLNQKCQSSSNLSSGYAITPETSADIFTSTTNADHDMASCTNNEVVRETLNKQFANTSSILNTNVHESNYSQGAHFSEYVRRGNSLYSISGQTSSNEQKESESGSTISQVTNDSKRSQFADKVCFDNEVSSGTSSTPHLCKMCPEKNGSKFKIPTSTFTSVDEMISNSRENITDDPSEIRKGKEFFKSQTAVSSDNFNMSDEFNNSAGSKYEAFIREEPEGFSLLNKGTSKPVTSQKSLHVGNSSLYSAGINAKNKMTCDEQIVVSGDFDLPLEIPTGSSNCDTPLVIFPSTITSVQNAQNINSCNEILSRSQDIQFLSLNISNVRAANTEDFSNLQPSANTNRYIHLQPVTTSDILRRSLSCDAILNSGCELNEHFPSGGRMPSSGNQEQYDNVNNSYRVMSDQQTSLNQNSESSSEIPNVYNYSGLPFPNVSSVLVLDQNVIDGAFGFDAEENIQAGQLIIVEKANFEQIFSGLDENPHVRWYPVSENDMQDNKDAATQTADQNLIDLSSECKTDSVKDHDSLNLHRDKNLLTSNKKSGEDHSDFNLSKVIKKDEQNSICIEQDCLEQHSYIEKFTPGKKQSVTSQSFFNCLATSESSLSKLPVPLEPVRVSPRSTHFTSLREEGSLPTVFEVPSLPEENSFFNVTDIPTITPSNYVHVEKDKCKSSSSTTLSKPTMSSNSESSSSTTLSKPTMSSNSESSSSTTLSKPTTSSNSKSSSSTTLSKPTTSSNSKSSSSTTLSKPTTSSNSKSSSSTTLSKPTTSSSSKSSSSTTLSKPTTSSNSKSSSSTTLSKPTTSSNSKSSSGTMLSKPTTSSKSERSNSLLEPDSSSSLSSEGIPLPFSQEAKDALLALREKYVQKYLNRVSRMGKSFIDSEESDKNVLFEETQPKSTFQSSENVEPVLPNSHQVLLSEQLPAFSQMIATHADVRESNNLASVNNEGGFFIDESLCAQCIKKVGSFEDFPFFYKPPRSQFVNQVADVEAKQRDGNVKIDSRGTESDPSYNLQNNRSEETDNSNNFVEPLLSENFAFIDNDSRIASTGFNTEAKKARSVAQRLVNIEKRSSKDSSKSKPQPDLQFHSDETLKGKKLPSSSSSNGYPKSEKESCTEANTASSSLESSSNKNSRRSLHKDSGEPLSKMFAYGDAHELDAASSSMTRDMRADTALEASEAETYSKLKKIYKKHRKLFKKYLKIESKHVTYLKNKLQNISGQNTIPKTLPTLISLPESDLSSASTSLNSQSRSSSETSLDDESGKSTYFPVRGSKRERKTPERRSERHKSSYTSTHSKGSGVSQLASVGVQTDNSAQGMAEIAAAVPTENERHGRLNFQTDQEQNAQVIQDPLQANFLNQEPFFVAGFIPLSGSGPIPISEGTSLQDSFKKRCQHVIRNIAKRQNLILCITTSRLSASRHHRKEKDEINSILQQASRYCGVSGVESNQAPIAPLPTNMARRLHYFKKLHSLTARPKVPEAGNSARLKNLYAVYRRRKVLFSKGGK